MDFTEVINTLKDATPYDLYRLRAALKIEMDNPERIEALQNSFSVNDQISYFNEKKNALCDAIVLEKNIKYVVVKDLSDNKMWNVPYHSINIANRDSSIYAEKSESLNRNHLSLDELVGFMHNGKQIVGHIKKFNPKTVKLLTADGTTWTVEYCWLFKVLEGQQVQRVSGGFLI